MTGSTRTTERIVARPHSAPAHQRGRDMNPQTLEQGRTSMSRINGWIVVLLCASCTATPGGTRESGSRGDGKADGTETACTAASECEGGVCFGSCLSPSPE